MSSTFSNLGGFIFDRSSVMTFRMLASVVKLTTETAPFCSSRTTHAERYPASLSGTQTYRFDANSAAAAASDAAAAPESIPPLGRSKPAMGAVGARIVLVRAICAMFTPS